MKRILLSLVIAWPALAFAQMPQISEEQMQQLMQGAAKIQSCLANVDQSALEKMMEKGKQMEAELAQLCKSGKRDKALAKAMKFASEYRNNKDLAELRKCGEQAMKMMPEMPLMQSIETAQDAKDKHICDAYSE